jgi:hypothetical protein
MGILTKGGMMEWRPYTFIGPGNFSRTFLGDPKLSLKSDSFGTGPEKLSGPPSSGL